MAAATELPRGIRINCVSPPVLAESPHYQPYFPGFPPADDVATAYLRAISHPFTGRILKLHKTNCSRESEERPWRWRDYERSTTAIAKPLRR